MALAAAASRFPGFERWAFAHDHARHAAGAGGVVKGKLKRFKPGFFTAPEYAAVQRLAELIIPSDDTPGAREAGASEFIDFMAGSLQPETQKRFRSGLAWLEARARKQHRRGFVALPPAAQREILDGLAYKSHHRPDEEEGRTFFGLIRDYTVMGFYTSEIGLQELDYQGFKFYGDSPRCPHESNPAHKDLPAPPRKDGR